MQMVTQQKLTVLLVRIPVHKKDNAKPSLITLMILLFFIFSLFNDERIRFPHKFSINEVLTSCLENTRRFPLGYKLNIATGRQKKKNTTQEESAFPNLK